jgi:hypothetical protein
MVLANDGALRLDRRVVTVILVLGILVAVGWALGAIGPWEAGLIGLLFPIVVTALKGKWGLVLLGFLITIPWFIGAVRLAKPGSWWARKLYDERQLERANIRFDQRPRGE